MKTEIILPEDDRAAKLITVTGWVSRKGNFFGKDEQYARNDGATHRKCLECGTIFPYSWRTLCPSCTEKKEIEKYKKREPVEWDGEKPVYSETNDRFFYDFDELLEYAEAEKTRIEDLRLMECKKSEFPPLNIDYFIDDFEIDFDVEETFGELCRLIDDFNEQLKMIDIDMWETTERRIVIGEKDEM